MKKNLGKFIFVLAIIFLIVGIIIYHRFTRPSYPEINSPRPFKGVENAKVKITEFSDFECPACKNATEMVKVLDEKYGYQAKIEFKHFPLVSIHRNAFQAAMASECANDQGKFWAYHDKLFANQENLTKKDLIRYARELNLDEIKFTACLDSKVKSKVVRLDMSEGNRLGVNATPTFFIDEERVENWQNLEEIVRKKLGLD